MTTQLLQVVFQAVDESADPKHQQPGSMAVAQNVLMDKQRRLRKRAGTTALSTAILGGGSITAGKRLLTRGDDLALTDGQTVYGYSPELASWQAIGRPLDLRITKRGLVDTTRSAATCDVAAYGNLLVTVFLSGSVSANAATLYCKVENIETGAVVMAPLLIGTGSAWPRVRISGTDAIIVYSTDDGFGAGWIIARKLSLVTMTLTAVATIDTGATVVSYGPCDFDIMTPTAGVPTIYCAWSLNAGTDRLKVGSFKVSDFTVATAATTFTTGGGTLTSMSVAAASDKCHVAASRFAASDIKVVTTNATFGAAVETYSGSSAKYASVSVVDGTSLLLAWSGSDAASSTPFKLTTQLIAKSDHAMRAGSRRFTWQVVAHSRPWQQGGRWFTLATVTPKDNSLITNTAIPNASSVILEIETDATATLTSTLDSPCQQVGTAQNLTAWHTNLVGHLVGSAVVGSTVYCPAAYRNREPLNFQNIPIGFDLIKIEAGGQDNHRMAVIGRGGLVAGAVPLWYDGASIRPYGFCHAPMIIGLAASGAGTGSMAAGVYWYIVVPEWRDQNGVLHQGIPSPPRSVTCAANDKVLIKVTSESISQHQGPPYSTANAYAANPVSFGLYRTEVGGSVYYRLTLEPDFQVVLNDPTAGFVQLAYDTKADADIGGGSPARPLNQQPQPYTGPSGTGGEVENIPPPPFITCTTHKGRLIGIDATKRTCWPSKDSTEDPLVAPGFNEALVLAFAGDKSALASLSETLVAFGERDIDIVHGDGPDASGNGNDWKIQRVQADVGCVNPRSLATTPMGVMFESQRGLELLTTALEVTWVGSAVLDTLALFPSITSAVLCREQNEVRFTCNKSDGTSGIVLAWDYLNKCWFTRTYKDTAGTLNASVAFVDAALIGGIYCMLTAGGIVYQETSAHCLDGGSSWVQVDVQMAWMSPGGPLAWHRIKDVEILGTPVTRHGLEVSLARDFAASWEQTKQFAEATLVTTPSANSTCRVTFKNQKCQAARVRIRDIAPANPANYSTGDGPILEGLAFRVGQKSGPAKTAAAEQG